WDRAGDTRMEHWRRAVPGRGAAGRVDRPERGMTTAALLLLSAALLVAPQRRSRLGRCGKSPMRWNWKLAAAPLGGLVLAALWLLPLSVVTAVGVVVATMGMRWRRRRRSILGSEELASTESGLDVIVGELRVGAHPVRAFEIAAAEVGGPVGDVFAAIAARARLGVNLDPAVPRAGPVVSQWDRISQQQRFTARVNAGLAGPRATAAVLTGLPVAGIGLGQMIGATPLSVLCSDGAGGALLVVGVMLACTGLLWCDGITGKALR
ncbi:type II secretion system F family protein, partial [Aduncisulcus paluster]